MNRSLVAKKGRQQQQPKYKYLQWIRVAAWWSVMVRWFRYTMSACTPCNESFCVCASCERVSARSANGEHISQCSNHRRHQSIYAGILLRSHAQDSVGKCVLEFFWSSSFDTYNIGCCFCMSFCHRCVFAGKSWQEQNMHCDGDEGKTRHENRRMECFRLKIGTHWRC